MVVYFVRISREKQKKLLHMRTQGWLYHAVGFKSKY